MKKRQFLKVNHQSNAFVLFLLVISWMAVGCGGADGATGPQGEQGVPGPGVLMNSADEPAGDNCVNGGIKVESGIDLNLDGVLSADEITATKYVCHGVGMNGQTSLVNASLEKAGENCANGGIRLDVGLDKDADGTLSAQEITSTQYICNGAPGGTPSGNGLYGVIYPRTGLPDEKCAPSIVDADKGGTFTGIYTTAEIAKIKAMKLSPTSPHRQAFPYKHSVTVGGSSYPDYFKAITDGTTSPYDIEKAAQASGTSSLLSENDARVCGLKVLESGDYTLQTYESWAAAEADGARVTHKDNCGFCSTMENLAVYMEKPELTVLVRECALVLLEKTGTEREREDRARQCIKDIGFDEDCAWIWFWNSKYTRHVCQSVCVALLEAPHHIAGGELQGALNNCLNCDEENSGRVFKAVAGRIRRNTGLPTSMCRPHDHESWLCHNYADNFADAQSCYEKPNKWTCEAGTWKWDSETSGHYEGGVFGAFDPVTRKYSGTPGKFIVDETGKSGDFVRDACIEVTK